MNHPETRINKQQALKLQSLGFEFEQTTLMDLYSDAETIRDLPSLSYALDWCRFKRSAWAITLMENIKHNGKWSYRGWVVDNNYKMTNSEEVVGYKKAESALLDYVISLMEKDK